MMRPMRDQITPGMVFQGLPMVFNADRAKGLNADYRFDITGDGGGTWSIRIADGTCEIVEGTFDREPDWRLELDRDTWIGMTTGDFIGQEAFLLGRVTLEGDPTLGLHFDELFVPPAA
jgi:putative sterol carrier protein